MKAAEIRELGVDELRAREKRSRRSAVPAADPEVDGAARGAGQGAELRRDLARIKTILREKQEVVQLEGQISHRDRQFERVFPHAQSFEHGPQVGLPDERRERMKHPRAIGRQAIGQLQEEIPAVGRVAAVGDGRGVFTEEYRRGVVIAGEHEMLGTRRLAAAAQ